jgi:electron transfer flavoprotein-quinone oxidoreductase
MTETAGDEDTLDVIVAGAGLAGLACAHECAAAGLQTIVLERGDAPGAKNLSGGRLYLEPLRDLCGELLAGAPFERPLTSESIVLCGEREAVSLRTDKTAVDEDPHSVTVLRARLDAHLAERVTAKGAMLLPGQRADSLIKRDGRVTGVKVGPENLHARVVVAADGVLSFLAEQAGLRSERHAQAYAVGIKEVIELDSQTIEERFGLGPGRGAARLYIGRVTGGLPGGGFIYTNKDSLSLGLVARIDALREWKDESVFADLLEEFKQRPELAPLIAGGRTVEYGAHLIPEGGLHSLPAPGLPGLLLVGDAAGLVLNTGAVLRGMDLAMASGAMAGRSIAASFAAGAGGGDCLERYGSALKSSFIVREMRKHRRAAKALSQPRLYADYPDKLARLATELFETDAAGEHHSARQAIKKLRRAVRLRDIWRIIRM